MKKLALLCLFPLAQAAYAGIYESSVLWDKSDITVCFIVNPRIKT